MRQVNLVVGNVCVLEHPASSPAMPCSSAPVRSVVLNNNVVGSFLVLLVVHLSYRSMHQLLIFHNRRPHYSSLFNSHKSLFTKRIFGKMLTVVITRSLHKDCLLAAFCARVFEPALLFEAPTGTALPSGVYSRHSARYSNVFRLVSCARSSRLVCLAGRGKGELVRRTHPVT